VFDLFACCPICYPIVGFVFVSALALFWSPCVFSAFREGLLSGVRALVLIGKFRTNWLRRLLHFQESSAICRYDFFYLMPLGFYF
jgi:hypothetical protein